MKNLARLPEPYRAIWIASKTMARDVDLAARLVEPPLRFDPVHGVFVRTDRRSMPRSEAPGDKAEGPGDLGGVALGKYYAGRQPGRPGRWSRPNRPFTPAPTESVRGRLAEQFCGTAEDRRS